MTYPTPRPPICATRSGIRICINPAQYCPRQTGGNIHRYTQVTSFGPGKPWPYLLAPGMTWADTPDGVEFPILGNERLEHQLRLHLAAEHAARDALGIAAEAVVAMHVEQHNGPSAIPCHHRPTLLGWDPWRLARVYGPAQAVRAAAGLTEETDA